MALAKQVVSVPLSGGLDTKTDDHWTLPGRLTLLENGAYRKDGRVSLRYGFTELSDKDTSGSTIGAGDALGVFNDELLKFKGRKFYAWSPGISRWIDKGTMTPLVVRGKQIASATAAQTMPHAASVSGQTLYAWEDGRGGARCSVVDDASGAFLLADQELNASAVTPKVAAFGSVIVVLYRVSGTLYSRVYEPSINTLGSEQSVSTDAHTSACHIDVAQAGAVNIVAYRTSTPEVKVGYLLETGLFAGAGSIYPNVTTVAEDPANCLACLYHTGTSEVWLAWHNGTNGFRGAVLNGDFTSKLVPTTIDSDTATKRNATGAFVSTSQARWYYEHDAAAAYNHYVKSNTLTSAGAAGTASVFKRSVGLAAKAFTASDVVYVPLAHDSDLQATYFLADEDGTVIGKMRALQAGGLTAKPGLPDVVSGTSSIYRLPALSKNRLVSQDNDVFTLTGVWECELDFTDPPQHFAAQLGGNLHVAGGVLYAYDGLSAVEHGFHLFPENISSGTSGTGGSMSDGTYQYRVVYEWTDAQGQVHRSAPSVALTVTLSAGTSTQKVTLTIPSLRLTAKTSPRGDVSLAVYRTEDSGTTFYRVSSVTSPTYNDPTADTVSFEDTLADASILANERLYTTGGVVENIGAPACSLIATSKTRVWIGGLEDGNRLLFSKQRAAGSAVGFSDLFEVRLTADGGKETALAVMDEALVIFYRSRIEYLPGDGPDDTGANSDFSQPRKITSDVGCIDPATIVTVPAGLMFKSTKGIYLLTRNLDVRYAGAPVEDYNALTMRSADLVEDANEVVFLTSDGPALVYNYFFDRWGTRTNHMGADAVIWNGTYHYLRNEGPVWQETPGAYMDNGSAISLKARTAWLHVGELQGFQRVWRAVLAGTYASPHTLIIRAGFDYKSWFTGEQSYDTDTLLDASTWGGDAAWGDGDVWGGVEDNVYQFEYAPAQQKCQAVRLEFELRPKSDAGEGASLAALSLRVGVKPGTARVSVSKRAG